MVTTPWPEVNELLTNSSVGGLIAAGQDKRPLRIAPPAQIAESQRILDAAEADPEQAELDQRHIGAWADSGDGYTVQTRVAVVSCIWCDYVAVAPTKREALAMYQRQHEQPMLDRERERMAARRAVRNG